MAREVGQIYNEIVSWNHTVGGGANLSNHAPWHGGGGQIYSAIITEEGEQIYSAILTGDQIPVTGRHKHEHTEKFTYRGLWVLGIPPKNETWSK